MDEPKQAEVVTIKEAIEKVKGWIAEKDFEKAKQGCEEILSVEKDNAEVKTLLEQANKGLGGITEIPEVKKVDTTAKINEVIPQAAPKIEEAPKTPDMIMKTEEKKEEPKLVEEKPKDVGTKPLVKKSFPLGKVILIILLLGIIGGLVFSYVQGWLNPAFEWVFGLFGL